MRSTLNRTVRRRAAGRALSSLLYRVSPLDAPTSAGTALLTTYLAALRTRGVDPLVILRHE